MEDNQNPNEMIRHFFKVSLDHFLVFDQDDYLTNTTDDLKAMLGQDIRTVCHQLFGEYQTDKLLCAFEKAKNNLAEERCELEVNKVNELQPQFYEVRIVPLHDQGGTGKEAMVIIRNFTEVYLARKKAEQESSAKTAFLATVSHGIRTPLNAIIGVNNILEKTKLDKHQEGYLRIVKNSSAALLNLANELLDFSKLEGGLDLLDELFPLDQLLANIHEIFQRLFKQKGISLICEFEESLPKAIYGDQRRLRKILTSLLTNALKYTDSGTVRLTAGLEGVGTIYFRITDTGSEMKDSEQPQLFTAMERTEKIKPKKGSDCGLGLAITSQLCQRMGGLMETESEWGTGTCFIIKIPFRPSEPGTGPKDQEPFSLCRAKVLVVDDIPSNLIAAADMLEDYGISPDTALSGKEAVEKVRINTYDLILMDHMMPGLDGIETVHKIRHLGGNATVVPIVALTANAVSGAMEMFLANGFDGFLAKPINQKELAECLRRCLPQT